MPRRVTAIWPWRGGGAGWREPGGKRGSREAGSSAMWLMTVSGRRPRGRRRPLCVQSDLSQFGEMSMTMKRRLTTLLTVSMQLKA